ncbi:MAG TPA: 4-hydroxy-tetrahydrodipicolinate reductase [Bacteroidia bacterium]|nr:4-hydroxy-tetrahydrodipicolinate reductase [Bacteroidia bacterium]
MNIALFGYGKMGREIEKIALERNHNIVLRIDQDNRSSVTAQDLKKADVAIEFSTPHTVIDNINFCLDHALPIVVGTTGWHTEMARIKKLTDEKNGSLFHASNFSLGVNLFFKLNQYLAGLMNKYNDYEVSMEEIHHVHKMDKPSGTAISLANQLIENIDRKTNWSITEKKGTTIFIEDKREGEVPGTHIIKYHSAIDDIEIMHKAHNRKGFALGAVIAAEFLKDKKGVYTMNDII